MVLRSTRRSAELVVVLRVHEEDERGRLRPAEVGYVTCRGRLQELQPQDIEAYAAAGEKSVLQIRKLYTQEFPGDDLSLVVTPDGIVHEVVGQPQRKRGSRATSRDIVVLRQRAAKRSEVTRWQRSSLERR